MKLTFAPLEGITGADFRRLHAQMFGGADRYYAPFIAPDPSGCLKVSRLRDLLPENNAQLPLVPQILANSAEAFVETARQLRDLGYEEINLNIGCPSGTVVSKHKGAALLAEPEALRRLLDGIYAGSPLPVSVKTRLGFQSTDEFPALLEIYNDYPIAELTIHARDRAGQYKSVPDRQMLLWALAHSRAPVCCNGNLFRPGDLAALDGAERFMLGRGAVMNPALFREIRGGAALEREELRDFAAALREISRERLSAAHTLAWLKELWYYWKWLFPGEKKLLKAIFKAREMDDYSKAATALFAGGAFMPDARFEGSDTFLFSS